MMLTVPLRKFPALEVAERNRVSIFTAHFLGLHSYGIREETDKKPPRVQMHDGREFGVFLFRSFNDDSPYCIEDGALRFEGAELPFAVRQFGRFDDDRQNFRVRTAEMGVPTLDGKKILSVDFHPTCKGGCKFCFYNKGKPADVVSEEDGFRRVRATVTSLHDFEQISVITGLFDDEKTVVRHIKKIAGLAHELGFHGKITYLGSQIRNEAALREVLEHLGVLGISFKYNFTVEKFSGRDVVMKGEKGELTIDEIEETFRMFKDAGLAALKYSYVAGLEGLDIFEYGARRLAGLASPGVSIFKARSVGQRNLFATEEYVTAPVDYLCQMRRIYEELYHGPVFGNQWGNIWPFPLERVSRVFY